MTTAGCLIIASMFFGFIFGYGCAKSGEYATVWAEYYSKKKRKTGEIEQPDILDTMQKGPIACGKCKHENFLVVDALTAGNMCTAKPEIEHCWDVIRGHYDKEHYQFCRNINFDGNCKLFEPKASDIPKESEITLTLPDGSFPEAIPGSTIHVTLKRADKPFSELEKEVVSFAVSGGNEGTK